MAHVNNPNASTAHFPENNKSILDCQNDSGFLSGSNLVSSSSIIEDSDRKSSDDHLDKTTSIMGASTMPDSGIDISEQLSSLNLTPNLTSTSTTLPSGAEEIITTQPPENDSPKTRFGLSSLEVSFLQEVFKRDEDGDTQLHVAVMGGFVEATWNITRILPHQAFLDLPNNTGRTCLHLAVAAGDSEIARHILVCGASPVARDYRGNTPLHVACSLGDMKMVTELTRPVTEPEVMVARLNYPPKHIAGLLAADLSNYDGQTCIHIAAQCGHREMLRHLTWYGADINAKEGKCGRTALHYAVEARDPNLVTFLSQSCRAALSVETYAGLTPYQLALANDAPAIATLLVELGAQGDPLPSRFADEDVDNDDGPTGYNGGEAEWSGMVDDLRIGGMALPLTTAVPVTTAAGPLNCDFY